MICRSSQYPEPTEAFEDLMVRNTGLWLLLGTLSGKHFVVAHTGVLMRKEILRTPTDLQPSLEREPRIPRQLILTGRPDSLQEMSVDVQKNVQLLLERNPDMRMKWFSDSMCEKYISKYHGERLHFIFKKEQRGALRGDICRTAVLAIEGGFYVDLDFDLRVPFHQLVDNSTTFMSVLESLADGGGVLNALIAVEPKSRVMFRLLRRIRKWYVHARYGLKLWSKMALRMGPMTLRLATVFTMARECPGEDLDDWYQQGIMGNAGLQRHCGDQVFRFYLQRRLRCKEFSRSYGQDVCTPIRMKANEKELHWLDYGIFTPGHIEDSKLVAFPHAEWCTELGCKAGGHDDLGHKHVSTNSTDDNSTDDNSTNSTDNSTDDFIVFSRTA